MLSLTKETGVCAALVSVVLGLIIWCNFRPVGVFFFSLLALFWARQHANLRLQMSPLVEEKLRSIANRALELRASRPRLFGALALSMLVLLVVIGHVVSGTYIMVSLLGLAFAISIKYDIKIVADREQVQSHLSASVLDQEVADFLPEINEADTSLLKQVGEEADVSAIYRSETTTSGDQQAAEALASKNGEDDDDDTYSDLMIPPSSIRELDEEDATSESSSDELLLPLNNSSGGSSAAAAVASAPATTVAVCGVGDGDGEIRFKSSHFNANTSSDSDDSISRGLSFDDVTDGRSRKKTHHHHHHHPQQPQQVHLHQLPQQQQHPHQGVQQELISALAGNLLQGVQGGMLGYLTMAAAAASANPSAAAMSQSHPAPSNNSLGTPRSNRMTVSFAATAPTAAAADGGTNFGGDESTDEDEDSDFEMLSPDELQDV